MECTEVKCNEMKANEPKQSAMKKNFKYRKDIGKMAHKNFYTDIIRVLSYFFPNPDDDEKCWTNN